MTDAITGPTILDLSVSLGLSFQNVRKFFLFSDLKPIKLNELFYSPLLDCPYTIIIILMIIFLKPCNTA